MELFPCIIISYATHRYTNNLYAREPGSPNGYVLKYNIHPLIRCCQCKQKFRKRCVGMENSHGLNNWTCYSCMQKINHIQG